MFTYIIAIISPLAYAVSNIIDSHISNNLFKRIESVVFYSIITNVLVIPFLFLFGVPKLPSLSLLPLLLLIGAIEVLYMIPYYIAIRKMDTSIIAALFNLGKISIPLTAFFIVDERLGAIQYIGFAIIVSFSIVLSLENVKSFKLNKAFWLMLGSSLLASLNVVLYKKSLQQIDWISNIFWVTIISALFCSMFLLNKKNRHEIFAQRSKFFGRCSVFMLNEFFNQIGVLAANYSIMMLPVVVYSGICATQAIFVLLIGYVVSVFYKNNKESLSVADIVKKLICFIFIILGVLLTI